ncbi:hypothetical protein MMC25_001834 [Agyrium rufum]|nr:hypothetical protein [Agyrium rufum]
MAATLYPDFPPKLSPKGEEYLLHNLKDWSLANGLVVRPVPALAPQEGKNPDILASVAPVTIFPSPFPRSCFEEAQAIQWTYNKLYAAIAEDEEWLAAIKCPSVLTHLAGSKKVQQVLATPSSPHLSRFIPSVRESKRLEETFAAIYPLDDSTAGKEAKKIALDPEKCKGYVLKPQREGGGNNIYRSAIPDFLKKLGDERHWRGYILMELIEPPALKNSILRDGVVKSGEVIGELGIYGVCLWETRSKDDSAPGEKTRGEIIENYEAGYLLRTKGRESEEGGVAAGFGSVDSVCLVDV